GANVLEVRKALGWLRNLFMEKGCARGQCIFRIKNRRKLLIIHLDQFQSFFGDIQSSCRNGRHWVSYISHFVKSYNRLVFKNRSVVGVVGGIANDVITGQYSYDAWQFFGLPAVNIPYKSMSIRAAENLDGKQTGKVQIVQILQAACYLLGAL